MDAPAKDNAMAEAVAADADMDSTAAPAMDSATPVTAAADAPATGKPAAEVDATASAAIAAEQPPGLVASLRRSTYSLAATASASAVAGLAGTGLWLLGSLNKTLSGTLPAEESAPARLALLGAETPAPLVAAPAAAPAADAEAAPRMAEAVPGDGSMAAAMDMPTATGVPAAAGSPAAKGAAVGLGTAAVGVVGIGAAFAAGVGNGTAGASAAMGAAPGATVGATAADDPLLLAARDQSQRIADLVKSTTPERGVSSGAGAAAGAATLQNLGPQHDADSYHGVSDQDASMTAGANGSLSAKFAAAAGLGAGTAGVAGVNASMDSDASKAPQQPAGFFEMEDVSSGTPSRHGPVTPMNSLASGRSMQAALAEPEALAAQLTQMLSRKHGSMADLEEVTSAAQPVM